MLEQVVIDISHQMQVALLLWALDGIVGSVEVRDENSGEVSEGLLENRSFTTQAKQVDDKLSPRKCPDVAAAPLDSNLCLVGVNQESLPQLHQHRVKGFPVNLSQANLSTLS